LEALHRGRRSQAGLKYIRTCAWRKVGSTPQFSGDRPAQAFETIVCAHRPGRTKWNAHGKHGYYEHPIVLERGNGVSRLHTTQKPLTLMAELVADFSNADELVMDPFAGSASTGKACQQLNRRFLGFELNRDYFDIACRRLRGEEAKPNPAQPSLFGGTP
jgi:DNA modification methylase